MRFETPVLRPDAARAAFFDGSEEHNARLRFACAACGADNETSLTGFVSSAWAWFRALDDADRQRIVRLFDCPLGEFDGRATVAAHDEGSPYFGVAACAACGRRHLLYVGFGEVQPTRYRAHLHGLVLLATDGAPDDAAALPLAPALSFALPFDSGRVLLAFADGQRRLTGSLFGGPALRRFGASPLGIAWEARAGCHVDALFAVSTALPEASMPPFALHLGSRDLVPSPLHVAHHECGFVLRPFAASPFVLYEAIGGGIAGGGGEAAFALAALRAVPNWRDELHTAGCDWAIARIEDAVDDTAAIRALVAAHVARMGPLRDPFPGACPEGPPTVARAPAQAAERAEERAPEPAPTPAQHPERGWFAAPGEPPLYLISGASQPSTLAEDIATVVERMRERRAVDGVDAGVDAVLFISDGTQYKLYAYWYDPDSETSSGEWRYTLVLRHLLDDEALDASDFEDLCRSAVDRYVGDPAPEALRVFFRYEYDPEILAIEGSEP
ncbi:MAG: hypothetical protein ACOY82_13655 [Pseudomonadota bacterium]